VACSPLTSLANLRAWPAVNPVTECSKMNPAVGLAAQPAERFGAKDGPALSATGGVRVGILDHTGPSLGGAQLVAGYLASLLARSYAVDLIGEWKEFGLERIAGAFSLDLSGVRQRRFEAVSAGFGIPGECGPFRQIARSRELTKPYELFIYCGQGVPPFCHARHGLIYCHFPNEALPAIEVEQTASWQGRNRFDRWMRSKAYERIWRTRMKGYDLVLANSSFTSEWIKRRWGVSAEVVYPPVDLIVPSAVKENLIVSIGRFDGVKGRKGHLAQVEAFRKFLTATRADWKLCLIGSCYGAEDHAYLALVREAARDLPVEFAVNAERGKMCTLLAKAKIFWHTAGLHDDEQEKPYKAEHFGIATVEAMRAGCIPVVIASGGQREIILHGHDGFLGRDLTELVEMTKAVAQNEALLHAAGERARRRSEAFSGMEFERRMGEIVRRFIGLAR
jgi:glycosyltransferase involved in cell wall biosynthesis